ncbi:hypothetical protein [Tumidithrix helvetica]|uniref:hypothetical protein n=1 Tax=Tumidithrix helvetica TaxID=3457545 RepID=UPI003CC6192F
MSKKTQLGSLNYEYFLEVRAKSSSGAAVQTAVTQTQSDRNMSTQTRPNFVFPWLAPDLLPLSISESISDSFWDAHRRIVATLREIENLLLVCTHEEISSVWVALQDMRNTIRQYRPDLPSFLQKRRVRRNITRILVTLTDLGFRNLIAQSNKNSVGGISNSTESPNQLYPN